MPDAKLPELNAMSIFYSRYGAAESLALAAGVGAVQARANIRIRRLRDLADASEIAKDQSWSENLERMTPEYIAPRDIDNAWADVIFLTAPLDEIAGDVALREVLAHLASLKGMDGKIAAVVNPSGPRCAALFNAATAAGYTVVHAHEENFDVTAFGKYVCEMARSMKKPAAQA